jgi:hypothetical protein
MVALASEPSYGSRDVICTVAAALIQRAIPFDRACDKRVEEAAE